MIDIPRSEACLIGPETLKSINISSDVDLLLIRTGFESSDIT